MRTVLVAALILVLALPAANAQMATAILDLQVKAPVDPVGPEGANVEVTIARVCQNTAVYLPDQIVRLDILSPPGSVIDGPESVTFTARPCLDPSPDERFASFVVKLPADAPPATALSYLIQAEPAHHDQVFGSPDSQEAEFQLVSPDAPEEPESDVEGPAEDAGVTEDDLADAAEDLEKASENGEVMNVPGPSWLFAVVGLGLAALRRRV